MLGLGQLEASRRPTPARMGLGRLLEGPPARQRQVISKNWPATSSPPMALVATRGDVLRFQLDSLK
jgi:hypothetical protein